LWWEDVKLYELVDMLLAEQKRIVEIKLLTENDAQVLWDLRMLALETDSWSFVESPEELRAMGVKEYALRLRNNNAANFVVGAFEQDKLVAMVGFYQEQPLKRRHKGWIWGVFVRPEARGRGIAKSLMFEAIRMARTIPELEVLLITVSVNQPAPRKLYATLGFRSIGIEPKGLKIGDKYLDEEHMVLEFANLQ
jgi:RimJ/RimL family protein N-acetyltransferase